MKNFIKSKKFIASALSVACIGIIAICWFISKTPDNEFMPEEITESTPSQNWQETPPATSGLAEKQSEPHTAKETETAEVYPKVAEVIENDSTESSAEETTKAVVIDFTPTEKPQETPPPAPEGKTVIEDPGPEHPVTSAPDVTPPPVETAASTEPAPGSSNGNGAVYDPVFGWVVPGEVIQSPIDSDGDPDKMVGNMGE